MPVTDYSQPQDFTVPYDSPDDMGGGMPELPADSASQPEVQQPMAASAAIAPVKRSGRLRDLFQDIIYGTAQGMAAGSQAGQNGNAAAFAGGLMGPVHRRQLEEDRAIKMAQLKVVQDNAASEKRLREATINEKEENGKRVMVMTPQGPIYLSQKAADVFQRTSAIETQKQKGKVEIEGIRDGLDIPVPAKLAQEIGMPELAGKNLGKRGWDNINKRLSADGKNLQISDIGADRWIVNRSTGEKVEKLGAAPGLVAGVARADQFAKSRAAYSLVSFQDPNTNEMRSGSALEAIQSGIPTVTRANGEKIGSRVAVMNDIKQSAGQLSESIKAMDNATGVEKLAVARILRDTHSTAGTFINSEIASEMRPELQDYVLNNLNMREQIYGLRKTLTGSAGGSDAQAAAMLATLPTSDSGEVARKKMANLMLVAGRLEAGIQKLGKSGHGDAPAGMVAVQIPGHPVGHIPSSRLAEFKKKYPDAVEVK